jgi:ATP-dependent Clp endopeptidase proteolytic subunit ClpP
MQMERTILLYDQFGQSWWDDGITAKGFRQDLQDCNDDAECTSILVAINSPGGSIGEGIAIYNAIITQNLDANAKPINTRNDGIAYSMGAIVLLAGKKVYAHENTTTMLHCCSGGAWGNVRDVENYLGQMRAVDKGLAKSIASKTGKTLESVQSDIMNYDDHFYTSDEAKDLGLIDEVISERTELAAQFEGLSYAEVMAKFQKKPDAQANFLSDVKNAIKNSFESFKPKPAQPNPQQSLEEPMKISNKLTALLAVFGLSASAAEDQDHTPTAEHLQAVNDQLQAANGHQAIVDDLNNQLSAKGKSITDLEAKVTALEKGSGAIPKAGGDDDVITDGPEPENELSETDAQLKAMRKDLGIETKNDK